MEDIQHLPLINPPFDPPPKDGMRWRDTAGFVYEMIEAKPHTNKDGSASFLLHMRGQCAECGELFLFKQGPKRQTLARRCPEHAKGKGREKTWPFGRGPAPAIVYRDSMSGDVFTRLRTSIDQTMRDVRARHPEQSSKPGSFAYELLIALNQAVNAFDPKMLEDAEREAAELADEEDDPDEDDLLN